MRRPPPTSTLFPYTTLFRSDLGSESSCEFRRDQGQSCTCKPGPVFDSGHQDVCTFDLKDVCAPILDRKSTRLNSSHRTISYAVFCLKKKKPFIVPDLRAEIH